MHVLNSGTRHRCPFTTFVQHETMEELYTFSARGSSGFFHCTVGI
jgi:hypothetical protein